jgi:hypothetical protein
VIPLRLLTGTENSPCLDNGILACPDPACRRIKRHISSLLDLVHHLILVHHFSPFAGSYLMVGLLKPLDTLVPLKNSDIDKIADAKTGEFFVPEGVLAARNKAKAVVGKGKVSFALSSSLYMADTYCRNGLPVTIHKYHLQQTI